MEEEEEEEEALELERGAGGAPFFGKREREEKNGKAMCFFFFIFGLGGWGRENPTLLLHVPREKKEKGGFSSMCLGVVFCLGYGYGYSHCPGCGRRGREEGMEVRVLACFWHWQWH